MEKTKHHEHDKFAKKILSQADVFRDLIEQLGPPEIVAAINLDSLELIDTAQVTPEFEEVFSDLVYKCRLLDDRPAWIVFLIEHKSFVPKFPPVQLLQYQANRWAETDPKADRLSPIVPIILYHGVEKWRKKPFEAYFGDLPTGFARYLPTFDYVLIDLSEYSTEQIMRLRRSPLPHFLLALKLAFDHKALLKNISTIFGLRDLTLDPTAWWAFGKDLYTYFCARFQRKKDADMVKIQNEIAKALKSERETMLDFLNEKAEMRGIEKGIEKKEIEAALNIIAKFPAWPDAEIADVLGCEAATVEKIRREQRDVLIQKLLSRHPLFSDSEIAEICRCEAREVEKSRAATADKK